MKRSVLGILLAGAAVGACPASAHTVAIDSTRWHVASDDGCTFKPVFRDGERLVYRYESITEHLPEKDNAKPPTPAEEPGEKPGTKPAPGADDEGEKGPRPLRSYSIKMTLHMAVIGVDEHGAASFAVLPDDIEINTTTEKVDTNAGFTRKQAEAASPLPEGAGFLPRLSLALARSALRVDVRADGTISEVSGLDDIYEMAAKEGREGARVVGPLSPQSVKRTLATFFRVDAPKVDGAFPVHQVDDTWRLVDRAAQSHAMDIVGTTTLKLESCTPAEAVITGAAVMTVEPALAEPGKEPVKPDPTQGVPTIEEQSDSISITWDPASGVLRKRTRDTLLSVSAKVGDARLNPMRFRTRSSIELVDAPK